MVATVEEMVAWFEEIDQEGLRLLATRPIQLDGMSVADYYNRFCVWKEKLDGLNYPCDEEYYVDDFLRWLKWDLDLRVFKYPSKPQSLMAAFDGASFEETVMVLEDLTGETIANKVLDEMPRPIIVDAFNDQVTDEALDEDTNAKVVHDKAEALATDDTLAFNEPQESQAKFEGVEVSTEDQYDWKYESKEDEALISLDTYSILQNKDGGTRVPLTLMIDYEANSIGNYSSDDEVVNEHNVFEEMLKPFPIDDIEDNGSSNDGYNVNYASIGAGIPAVECFTFEAEVFKEIFDQDLSHTMKQTWIISYIRLYFKYEGDNNWLLIPFILDSEIVANLDTTYFHSVSY